MKIRNKILAGILTLTLAAGLAGCGTSAGGDSSADKNASGESAGLRTEYSTDNPVTVKIGLTAAIYEDIWDPIKEELAGEGIDIEYVQFSDFALPNEALENGEIDLTAQQHHAYMNNQVKEKGWNDLTAIADTFIIAMNIYSNDITDVSQLKDGDTVAVPNDVTNEGRALKLLADAGVIEIDPAAGSNPEITDITSYSHDIELVEMNASDIPSALPDVTAAVINGNYALDAGINPDDDAIFYETKYDDDSYFCLIGARSDEADSPVFARIIEAFQSEGTKEIFQNEFKGYFKPAWEYKF